MEYLESGVSGVWAARTAAGMNIWLDLLGSDLKLSRNGVLSMSLSKNWEKAAADGTGRENVDQAQ